MDLYDLDDLLTEFILEIGHESNVIEFPTAINHEGIVCQNCLYDLSIILYLQFIRNFVINI